MNAQLNANMKGFAVRRKTPFEIEKEKKEQKKRVCWPPDPPSVMQLLGSDELCALQARDE